MSNTDDSKWLETLISSLNTDQQSPLGQRLPGFPTEELQRNTTGLSSEAALRQASDNPGAMARETLMLSIFPAGSINAPAPREAMLKAVPQVTLEQIKAFHAKYYGPAHMTLVFAGDVDAKAIEAAVAMGSAPSVRPPTATASGAT